MTPQEALDRIAALCDHHTDPAIGSASYYMAGEVRAVLAEVTPETGCTLDRDQAREWVRTYSPGMHPNTVEHALDALAGCVRPGAGVTLTPEEAARTLLWWAIYREEGFPGITDAALVARLEATR